MNRSWFLYIYVCNCVIFNYNVPTSMTEFFKKWDVYEDYGSDYVLLFESERLQKPRNDTLNAVKKGRLLKQNMVIHV